MSELQKYAGHVCVKVNAPEPLTQEGLDAAISSLLTENRELKAVYEAADRYIHSFVEDGSFQALEDTCAAVQVEETPQTIHDTDS